jgi:hypothetical protein
LSAGRCQFPGCKKFLWADSLTLKEDKFANIAHIIADSPEGPRGDEALSKALSRDISNLMLMCLDHHKLIDGKHKDDYSVQLLRTWKLSHEERIRIQTDMQPNHTSTVLRFMANIGTQPINIPIAQAYQAIMPNYPANAQGITIDLSNLALEHDAAYWVTASRQIKNEVAKYFSASNTGQRVSHVSVFAIGPMPLLMQLGYSIGNVVPMEIYQRHRDTQDWTWKSQAPAGFKFILTSTDHKSQKDVSLSLSLSGKVLDAEIDPILGTAHAKYEITIDTPRVDFLHSPVQLEEFRAMYRQVLTEIRQIHGHDVRIHLFPAVPAPIAVICGKELFHNTDPDVIVYQKDRIDNTFKPAITIKGKE